MPDGLTLICIDWGTHLPTKELADFLIERCKEKGISLRGLSIGSGLSPATVHNIIKRKYQPTLFSLNRLADRLGVKREYLWQIAGLLEDMDYDTETTFGDPQLRFHFARVDKLTPAARRLIIAIIEALIIYLEGGGRVLDHGPTFSLSGDNKGLTCPFKLIDCEEGYCAKCQLYHDWRVEQAHTPG